jgi:hypothetical protein
MDDPKTLDLKGLNNQVKATEEHPVTNPGGLKQAAPAPPAHK